MGLGSWACLIISPSEMSVFMPSEQATTEQAYRAREMLCALFDQFMPRSLTPVRVFDPSALLPLLHRWTYFRIFSRSLSMLCLSGLMFLR